MPLNRHDKEVVAVAASIAAGCRPCTTYHRREARRAGVSEDDIAKAVAGAVCVRNGATEGMRRHGLGLEPPPTECGCGAGDRLAELAALGAALAVNCTANIEKHLAFARQIGVTEHDIRDAAAVANMIRGKAVEHAEAAYFKEHGPAAMFREPEPAPAACCSG
jgi:AhpD family alkylhydroperoxidase